MILVGIDYLLFLSYLVHLLYLRQWREVHRGIGTYFAFGR
jgi:hypothetical protein